MLSLGLIRCQHTEEGRAEFADGISHQLVKRREAGRYILRPRPAPEHTTLPEPHGRGVDELEAGSTSLNPSLTLFDQAQLFAASIWRIASASVIGFQPCHFAHTQIESLVVGGGSDMSLCSCP